MPTTYPVQRWQVGSVRISRVVESRGRVIVVDTCVGNDKPRVVAEGGAWRFVAEAG